jgi:PTS system galactitol-specific IIA component
MIKELIGIEKDANTWEEAIRFTSDALLGKRYVKSSFYQACVDREKKFPTGLPTAVPVAIPHTDAGHVNVPSVCLMHLARPVPFASMEDSDETVDVEFVFNMALVKCEDQLSMIKAIIEMVQDMEFWLSARSLKIDDIVKAIYSRWSADGVIE